MLMRYSAWANGQMFDALAALPAGEAERARTTGFGNMLHTLNHCLVVDQIWQAHLEGRPHGFSARNTSSHPPLEELRRAQSRLDDWYIRYADGMVESIAEEILRFEFVGGGEGAMRRSEMLLHVVNHKTYHRGVVADMIYQVPARPPVMDLPVFLRDVERPASASPPPALTDESIPATTALPAIASGRYRHYKGGEYEVLGVARHSETGEALVLYRPLYGDSGLWVRPHAMFVEEVVVNGRRQARFAALGIPDRTGD